MQEASPHPDRATPALVLALALLGALAVGGVQALKQWRMAPGTVVPAEALAAKSAPRSSDLRPQGAAAPPVGPGWEVLTTPQKLALYPLAPRWAVLSEKQKRSWLAIAQGFAALPALEQERLHSRMTEWTTLSAQQRSQARLNYAATQQLAPDNKRAQWEAYQALSKAEKNRLTQAAVRRPQGAATAVQPVAARKLVKVPSTTNGHAAILSSSERPPYRGSEAAQPGAPLGAAQRPLVVETAPVSVPVAVPVPLPPLAPAAPPAPPAEATSPSTMPPDMASQYSH